MANFDDDELPVSKGASAAAATATVTNASAEDVDLNDDSILSALEGLEQLKPAKGQAVRFALLTKFVKMKMNFIHFIQVGDKKHAVKCHSVRKGAQVIEEAICCQKLKHDENQAAQPSFAALALRYKNADPETGKYAKDASGEVPAVRFEIGWVKLSGYGFKNVKKLAFEGENIDDFDMVMTVAANGKGLEYARATRGEPRYMSDAALVAEVKKATEQYVDGVALSKRLGKVVSLIDLKAMLAGKSAGAKGGSNHNTDDL